MTSAHRLEHHRVLATIAALVLVSLSIARKIHTLGGVSTAAILLDIPFLLATILVVARLLYEFTWENDSFFLGHKLLTYAALAYFMQLYWEQVGPAVTLLARTPSTQYVPFISEVSELVGTLLCGVLAMLGLWIPCAIAAAFYRPQAPLVVTPPAELAARIERLRENLTQELAHENYAQAAFIRDLLVKLKAEQLSSSAK
jgi:hypothetical protein